MALVAIQGVWRSFGRPPDAFHALKDVTLEVEPGDFMVVKGRSGSGKTTLLNLLSGLDSPTRGTLTVRGRDLSRVGDGELSRYRNASVGYVFQAFHLENRRTALANVTTPLIFTGEGRKSRAAKGLAALEKVGLADRAHQTAATLSAGQKQRVALARALINDPEILLADEPTANLDVTTAEQIVELILGLSREQGRTIFLVSHEKDLVIPRCRHIAVEDGVVREVTADVVG